MSPIRTNMCYPVCVLKDGCATGALQIPVYLCGDQSNALSSAHVVTAWLMRPITSNVATMSLDFDMHGICPSEHEKSALHLITVETTYFEVCVPFLQPARRAKSVREDGTWELTRPNPLKVTTASGSASNSAGSLQS